MKFNWTSISIVRILKFYLLYILTVHRLFSTELKLIFIFLHKQVPFNKTLLILVHPFSFPTVYKNLFFLYDISIRFI